LFASLATAATSAALAVIVGAGLALLFTVTDFPQPSFWATLALLPFVSPSAVVALGQVHCYGPGGLVEAALGDHWRPMLDGLNPGHYTSTVFVLAAIHAPLTMLIVGRGLRRIHLAGLEAALHCLSPFRLLQWIAGAVRGELTAAFLLALALGLGNFAVPHVLQCRLYPIEIYCRITNYLDPAGAVWAALPMLVITVLAAGLVALTEGGAVYVSDAPQQRLRLPLGRWMGLFVALVAVYLGLTTVLPLVATMWACKSPLLFLEAVRDAAPETENTLCIGAGASVFACICGLVVAVGLGRRTRSLLNVLATVPLGVPALIVGLADAGFFSRIGPLDLSGIGNTSWLVVLGLGFRGWPFATRVIANGRRQQAPEWQEMARLCGGTAWRRWTWISGPLVRDQIVTAAILAYVLSVGEVEITQMLCAPGEGTLALRLFTFLHLGPSHVAASLALLQLLLAVVPVLLYYLACDRCLQVV
jgi:ABC-type Fe3+ transport system permease subunit